MRIKCPYGRCKLGVSVYDGVCDAADLCGHDACEFFDLSPEATRRFLKAMAHYATIEGLLEEMEHPELQLQPRADAAYENEQRPTVLH